MHNCWQNCGNLALRGKDVLKQFRSNECLVGWAGSYYYPTNIIKAIKCISNVLVMLVFDYRLVVLFIGFICFFFFKKVTKIKAIKEDIQKKTKV